jgi:16S rRNA C967 or C1407 C5-methylase (RsmB/RsmF family)
MQTPPKASSLIPKFLLDEYSELLGKDLNSFLVAIDKPATKSLRWNQPKVDKYQLDKTNLPTKQQLAWSPNSHYLKADFSPITDPLWYAGCYYIQEPSSQIISQYFNNTKSQTVLDLCAAPGGKTTLALDLFDQQSLIVANEVVSKRARVLKQNLIQWGKTNLILSQNQTQDFALLGSFFDYVLVDAPCSGEGLCRKDPYVFNTIDERTIWGHVQRQNKLLQDACRSLKAGGIMIYSTCTFTREENEQVVKEFLENHPNFEVVKNPELQKFGMTETIPGCYRAYPHKISGEGFFVCGLKKTANLETPEETESKDLHYKNLSKERLLKVQNYIDKAENFEIRLDGKQVLITPAKLTQKIDLLSSKLSTHLIGLNAGQFKGNDFVPSQDLALSTSLNSNIFPNKELTHKEALKYYQQGLLPETEKDDLKNQIWTYLGIPLRFRKQVKNS